MARHRKKITAKPNHAKRPKGPSCGERVKLMKENFMSFHKKGYTVSKIARMFDLGESTVYDALDEIAAANNVTRESLLWKVKREAKTELAPQPESKVPTPEVAPQSEVKDHTPEVIPQDVPIPKLETIESTSVEIPTFETVKQEYEEAQQVLVGMLEIVTQLDDTLAQVLEEEKRYA
jgi:transposase-like protein